MYRLKIRLVISTTKERYRCLKLIRTSSSKIIQFVHDKNDFDNIHLKAKLLI